MGGAHARGSHGRRSHRPERADRSRRATAESLLPYDDWTEAALRQVMLRALQHAAAEGLPGEHHFYITFRTDYPGVALPVAAEARSTRRR